MMVILLCSHGLRFSSVVDKIPPAAIPISLGKINSFTKNDSIYQNTMILYASNDPVDEQKLKQWLLKKFKNNNIEVLKKNTEK
ncbi:hypothetical protein CHRY9390_01852 [Chryseobacterium aquaeductus]|uniref:Uncharacterized protein n=1 Tax=Chryseobacterium aquaeductus TaxID=2675056 RepID=A0A9N8QS77_9FLAO|nr:hypothetical protein [Chryseobacterium aquaeductus]CAA7331165.1 hypothetical protein CHRY9390_01852 [Chryseobacterium potabilaquae]CAD7808568.1 hypothetical protein CHRY9390_01852 [Chryseobacterium aquaeductus]